MDIKTIFLVLAAVITVYSVVPYLRDIVKGSTKPNIVSWITWTLLTGIATSAQIAAHEYVAAIFSGSATLATTAVVVLGLWHGYVKYTNFDTFCQVGAVVGIILWQLFDSPSIGVVASVAIDFVGAMPTLRHAWQKPGEETWQTFALAGVGGLFSILSLSAYNLITVPYALYILAINIVFTFVIIHRGRALKIN